MGSRIQADLRRKFNDIRHAQTYEDMQDGFIGIDSDTDPKEGADPGYVWVRPGNQNATPIQAVAQNTRVEFPDMKVRLAKNPGTRRWEIVRVHDDETERYGDYIATLNQPLRQPELLYDERVFMERLTNLRMYPGTGLTLEVEPGYYRKPDGTWVGFAGSSIDLTADVPGTVDQKRIVLIGIVYSTGLLTSDAQTAVSSYNLPRDGKLFELADVATALNAAATTVKWIGALPLIYGQTQLKWLFQYTALGQLAETLAGQYVAKTGDTMTGPLVIDGTTDAIQLTVQGHSTQTSNLVVLEDSAGNDLVTISGTGDTVFNEQGNAVDFRVEGDTATHALFVDGSADKIGVNTNAPQALLSVNAGALRLTNALGSDASYSFIEQVSANRLSLECIADTGLTSIIDFSPQVIDGTSTALFRFFRTTSTTGLAQTTWFRGDATSATIHLIGNAGAVFNQQGDDIDFRVEGDTDTNLFFADAGNDNIGIGTIAPDASAKLDITSTTGALLLPRMTTTQRNALTATNGMGIYNTTTNQMEKYQAGAWAAW